MLYTGWRINLLNVHCMQRSDGMKSLLILSFVILFAYLVLYVCGFWDAIRRQKDKPGHIPTSNTLAPLVDRLMSLTDHQLMLLKDDLRAIRSTLEKPVSQLSFPRAPFVSETDNCRLVHHKASNANGSRLQKPFFCASIRRPWVVDRIIRYQLIIIQTVLVILIVILVWMY